jgi:hypothetical protein
MDVDMTKGEHHRAHHHELIKSDIYAVTYAEVALAATQGSGSNGGQSASSRPGVFVIIHANGTVALVDPNSGLPLARYPHMHAVSLCGTGQVISDASIVCIGHSKKLGVRTYRVTARGGVAADEDISPARAGGHHPLRDAVYSQDASAPFSVAITELCSMPVTAEAVTAVSVAYMKSAKCLVVMAFDTASTLHMWTLYNNSSGSKGAMPLRSALNSEREEAASPILCMAVCRGADVWCGYEDGSIAVYRCHVASPATPQLQKHSPQEDLLSSPLSKTSSFAVRPARLIDSPLAGPQAPSVFARSVSPLQINGDRDASSTEGFEQVMRVPKAGRSGVLSVAPLHRGRNKDDGTFVGAACVLFGTESGDILVFSSISFRLLREIRSAHGASAIPAMCTVAPLFQIYSISTDQRLVIWSVSTQTAPSSSGAAETDEVPVLTATPKEVAVLDRVADVSLASDVSGSVYCLCYAAQIGTVAGGGTQSELLCWFPSEQEPVDASPVVEEVRGAPTPTPSSRSSSSGASTITLSVQPLRQVAQVDEPTEAHSPPRTTPPPSPTPKLQSTETRPLIPPPPPPALEPMAHQSVVPAPPQPRSLTSQPPPSTFTNTTVQTDLDASAIAGSTEDTATLRSELGRLLEAIEQMRGDHALELDLARRGYATQFDATVLRLQAEAAMSKDELQQQVRRLEEQLVRERDSHRDRLDALRADDSDVTAVIAAYKIEVQHLSEDLTAALKQRESDAKQSAIERDTAVRAAREEERLLWGSRLQAQQHEADSLLSKLETRHEHELEELRQQRNRVSERVAADSSADGASRHGSGGVVHLLEALTAELRRLKKKQHAKPQTAETSHIETQTDDVHDASNGTSSPARDTASSLRRQLRLVESLLSQHHDLQPHHYPYHTWSASASNAYQRPITSRAASASLARLNASLDQVPSGSPPRPSTSVLTSVYFMMRDVLGMTTASEVLEEVLSDSTTSDEELTELVVLQLCRRLREAAGGPAPTGYGGGLKGLVHSNARARQIEEIPALPARTRGDAPQATHPLLRGYSSSPVPQPPR